MAKRSFPEFDALITEFYNTHSAWPTDTDLRETVTDELLAEYGLGDDRNVAIGYLIDTVIRPSGEYLLEGDTVAVPPSEGLKSAKPSETAPTINVTREDIIEALMKTFKVLAVEMGLATVPKTKFGEIFSKKMGYKMRELKDRAGFNVDDIISETFGEGKVKMTKDGEAWYVNFSDKFIETLSGAKVPGVKKTEPRTPESTTPVEPTPVPEPTPQKKDKTVELPVYNPVTFAAFDNINVQLFDKIRAMAEPDEWFSLEEYGESNPNRLIRAKYDINFATTIRDYERASAKPECERTEADRAALAKVTLSFTRADIDTGFVTRDGARHIIARFEYNSPRTAAQMQNWRFKELIVK